MTFRLRLHWWTLPQVLQSSSFLGWLGGGAASGVQACDWLEESEEPIGLELFIVSSKGYRIWTSSVKQIIKT